MKRVKQIARKSAGCKPIRKRLRDELCREHLQRIRGEFKQDDSIAEDHCLTWRKENSNVYSDYSIIIVVTKQTTQGDDDDEHPQEQEEITYNVHKQNLACGLHRSMYFARLFEGGNFSESQTNGSRIELHELAAKAFPTLLDFLYYTSDHHQNGEFLTLQNAMVLYYLATYFDVPNLAFRAKMFCFREMDCNADTCVLFYEHATILQASIILEPVTRYCKLSLPDLSVKSRLMHITSVQFWIDILQDNSENKTFSKSEACKVSLLVVVFCQNSTLSLEEFKMLTHDDYLPEGCIHPQAAFPLMDLERKIVLEADQDRHRGDDEENEDESQTNELSNLQKRCVNVILQNHNKNEMLVEDLPDDDDDELEYDSEAMLLNLPEKVKQAFLASLQRATTMGQCGHGGD